MKLEFLRVPAMEALARLAPTLALLLALRVALGWEPPSPVAAPGRPRLVVLISIDQFRADYLTRFEDLYLPARSGSKVGGFRYLMQEGAWYTDAYHDHLALLTGPGHAVLLTGAPPCLTGIVGNEWYDRDARAVRYCVEDADSPLVGTTLRFIFPASARNSGSVIVRSKASRKAEIRASGVLPDVMNSRPRRCGVTRKS